MIGTHHNTVTNHYEKSTGLDTDVKFILLYEPGQTEFSNHHSEKISSQLLKLSKHLIKYRRDFGTYHMCSHAVGQEAKMFSLDLLRHPHG